MSRRNLGFLSADPVDVQMGPGYEAVISDPAKFAAYQSSVSSAPGYKAPSSNYKPIIIIGIAIGAMMMFGGKR